MGRNCLEGSWSVFVIEDWQYCYLKVYSVENTRKILVGILLSHNLPNIVYRIHLIEVVIFLWLFWIKWIEVMNSGLIIFHKIWIWSKIALGLGGSACGYCCGRRFCCWGKWFFVVVKSDFAQNTLVILWLVKWVVLCTECIVGLWDSLFRWAFVLRITCSLRDVQLLDVLSLLVSEGLEFQNFWFSQFYNWSSCQILEVTSIRSLVSLTRKICPILGSKSVNKLLRAIDSLRRIWMCLS